MMKSINLKINTSYLFLIVFACQMYNNIHAQTTVHSSDFNTSQGSSFSTSGQFGSTAWYVNRSGDDWGARIDNNILELTNDASVTANSNGWVFVYTSTSAFTSPYERTLSANGGTVSWYFNMRQIRSDPGGFEKFHWVHQFSVKTEVSRVLKITILILFSLS